VIELHRSDTCHHKRDATDSAGFLNFGRSFPTASEGFSSNISVTWSRVLFPFILILINLDFRYEIRV